MTAFANPIARALALTAFCLLVTGAHAATPAAVTADPPQDKAHAAAMVYVRIPSQGELMNGVLYTAAGAGPHPAVMLFHGFPGNEQNLDLAQAMRRAGYDVLTMHYRGAWGSPGRFSFTHALEDSDAAIAFLKANAGKFHIDATRIFVAGHSMGGWMAASATAHDPDIAGAILISAADMGMLGARFRDPVQRSKSAENFRESAIPLAGTSGDALMEELIAHGAGWDFVDLTPKLKSRPMLVITADDNSPVNNRRLAQALRAAGGTVKEIHFPTDHPYSDQRIALESAVVEWLQSQKVKRPGRAMDK